MANVVLIGMPGCGKSTIGVLLAKALKMNFLDTDAAFQNRQGRRLQEIIDEAGIDAFLQMEEECVLAIDVKNTVIATGGSVVYGEKAMRHLHEHGIVVYLKLPYDEIEKRLSNLDSRGVTLRQGQTLRDLYNERIPLYEKEADIVFDPGRMHIDETAQALKACMDDRMGEKK